MLHIKKCPLIKERNTEIPQFYTFKGTTKTQNQGKTEKKNEYKRGHIIIFFCKPFQNIYTFSNTINNVNADMLNIHTKSLL